MGAVRTTVRPPVQKGYWAENVAGNFNGGESIDLIIMGDIQSNRLVPLLSDSYRLMSG